MVCVDPSSQANVLTCECQGRDAPWGPKNRLPDNFFCQRLGPPRGTLKVVLGELYSNFLTLYM